MGLRIKLVTVIFIGILCSTATGYAQHLEETASNRDTTATWQLLKHDFKYTLKGVGHAFTRPIHWKGKDFTRLGILFTGTAALSLADKPVRELAQNNHDDFPKVVRDFGWYFGSPQNYFAANAGLYAFGILTKNEKVRKTSVLIISSSITTGIIQSISKAAIGRARPGSGFNPYTFNPFSGVATYRSFPSGHTILSMTMAHAIAKQFENPWVKAGVYMIGSIPPISRIIDDAHWLTDIALSTALSIIVVDSIDKFLFSENAYEYPKKKKYISWNLKFAPNQIGVVGTF